ncbi:hypothetical protein ALC60_01351 [Trachymyrmex zeteki]|uniref:Spaetzle domain-containing protein n=1 Tax=Mycetomoellerius zeteki TaxID=64791 RepID=A0A151XH85_9HYME|nr:hypothetical protein ALC60_01351 [Trachymyrmex zeteki]
MTNGVKPFRIPTCGVDPPRVRFTHHQIAEFFILNHMFSVLSKPLNYTQLFRNSFGPKLNYQNYLRDVPVMRDVSYPLEEYYDTETAARGLQQLNRDSRNMMHEYRNLCETITKKMEIFDDDYEYQPSHYFEVYCKGYLMLSEDERIMKPLEQKCVHPAFQCVQRSRVLSLVRRRWDNECWEPYTKEIASGCDCMWPVTNLGEINEHY